MPSDEKWSRLYPATFAAWIVGCVLTALLVRGAEDPSRRHDRMLNTEAADRAVAILRQRDPQWRDGRAIHTAWAGKGEGGAKARWIVLVDHAERPDLGEARVVELDGKTGELLTIRSAE